jgi:hypothetical protein
MESQATVQSNLKKVYWQQQIQGLDMQQAHKRLSYSSVS